MAFCPNCGTPNTDQAEKCVSCGFELGQKQKAKFKGTIMMSGINVPGQAPTPSAPANTPTNAPPPAAPAASAAAPASTPTSNPPDRNLAFQKTMVGHAGMVPPPAQPRPAPGPTTNELAHAPTMQGAGPAPGAVATGKANAGGAADASWSSSAASGTGRFSDPSGRISSDVDSRFPSSANKPNPGKALAIGCAALVVLTLAFVGIVWALFGSKIASMFGDDSGGEALAWQASIGQSLAQVAALCQSDCQQAAVFFHASAQSAVGEGKNLTEARIRTLSDPASSKAEMLDGTGDEEIAKKLGLDAQQCARITAGMAKVVSCSVPEPDGKPSVLRIIHLSGLGSL
jgi:hypothetical protein